MRHLKEATTLWGIFVYLTIFVAAVNSVFYPSMAFLVTTSPLFTNLWIGGVIIASGLCLSAVVFKKWRLEFVSLPLLSAIILIYAVVVFVYAGSGGLYYISPSLYLVAFAGTFAHRYSAIKRNINNERMTNENVQSQEWFRDL